MKKEKRRHARRSQRQKLANLTQNFNYSLKLNVNRKNRKNQCSIIENDEFKLISLYNLALYDDYKSYKITYKDSTTIIGFMGLYNSGIFNYVIYDKGDMIETRLLIFIKNFIKELGLNPVKSSVSMGKISC